MWRRIDDLWNCVVVQAGKYADALKSYDRAIENLKMFAGEDA